MAVVAGQTCAAGAPAAQLQQQIRARLESLSYLPTTAGVAIKFVALGKDPDASPADYARIIGADSAMTSKLLALSNSSWAGLRTKVTTVKAAVNLLGLATVRALAISYCMTGLHNELRLTPAESVGFWEAGLYKAVAAKHLARRLDETAADEAFVAGLFQDFALAVMYSVARQPYLDLLHDATLGIEGQLEAERRMFGLDHTEVGRTIAQKIELPELFVDTVAFHHNYETLSEFVDGTAVRDGCYAAALLPHALKIWSATDAQRLGEFLTEHVPGLSRDEYIAAVQREFDQLYGFFNEGQAPQAQLADLLVAAAREIADRTTEMVGHMNDMLRQAADQGAVLEDKVRQLEAETRHDALTGALTREAFSRAAAETLAQAVRYHTSLAVLYLDFDCFKRVNDRYGHAAGDRVLSHTMAAIRELLPDGALLGRLGGDEFVLLVNGLAAEACKTLAARIVARVREFPIPNDAPEPRAAISAGVLYVDKPGRDEKLAGLVSGADQLMYMAKRAGGDRIEMRAV